MDESRMQVAWLGLGAMGERMAARLAEHTRLRVFNRTPPRAEAWEANGAQVASTPRAACDGAAVAISMVRDDEAARAVWLHPEHGALAGLAPGALVVESSTVTAAWIAELGAACDAAGLTLVDAPVAGSTPQAEAGQLVHLLGGDDDAVARLEGVLTHLSAKRLHVGPRGHGARFKLIVNALFATQVAALSELLHSAEASGLGAARCLELLAPLPVTSPAAAGVAGLMLAGDDAPRFPVALVEKDLGYAVAAGAGPVVEAARTRFAAAIAAGHGSANLSAVHRLAPEAPAIS